MARHPSTSEKDAVEQFYNFLESYLEEPGAKSRAQLAAEAGVSRGYMYKLKDRDREPTLGVASRLAKAMGTTLGEIEKTEFSYS